MPVNGASRVVMWVGGLAAAATLFSVLGTVYSFGFKTQSNTDAIETMRSSIQRNLDNSTLQQDRITKLESTMAEIETQFCAQDIVRNLMHANDMRTIALLWEKSYGAKISTDNAYYPTICNRPVRKN